jgi:hypothetical protein
MKKLEKPLPKLNKIAFIPFIEVKIIKQSPNEAINIFFMLKFNE